MAKKKKLDPQTERRKEVEEFLIAQYEDYPHMADPVNPTGGGGGGVRLYLAVTDMQTMHPTAL